MDVGELVLEFVFELVPEPELESVPDWVLESELELVVSVLEVTVWELDMEYVVV